MAQKINPRKHNNIYRPCPLCGTDNTNIKPSVYSSKPWIIKMCARCRLVYLENPPSYEELCEDYAWEKTSRNVSDEKTKRESTLRRGVRVIERYKDILFKRDKLMDLVNQYFPAGPIIDVGCGGGEVMARLDKKYIPYGVEVSKYLAGNAQKIVKKRGGRVIYGNALRALDEFEKNYFIAAIMSAYFEHESAPREVLQKILLILRPGAKIIIKVPNYGCLNRVVMGKKWCGFRYPDHVTYWTPKTITRILSEAGFQIIRHRITDRLPTSDNMWLVASKPIHK